MNVTLTPGPRRGTVRIPASKSQAHRLLLCAALGEKEVTLRCDGLSGDIRATIACLNALGAEIAEAGPGALRVTPIRAVPDGVCELSCGESGSTLRFLLPVIGALGARAVFHREGRLPERPLAPLDEVISVHGMELHSKNTDLFCEGKLLAGDYEIKGNVSSQFITGLLYALPLLAGNSTLDILPPLESAPYVAMTESALALAGVRMEKDGSRYRIPGGQRFALPQEIGVEGDWSNAAFFLCMGALSPEGVRVEGLDLHSAQGDRAVPDMLRRFGAAVKEAENAVAVRRGALCGCTVDAAAIPDLIPALSAVAAAAEGETRIVNAARLRLKESDRLRTTAAMLTGLGADVQELPDGLVIRGKPSLAGGSVDAANDHRIAMAAAVAACACEAPVTVLGAECAEKSYPAFWEDLARNMTEDVKWLSM